MTDRVIHQLPGSGEFCLPRWAGSCLSPLVGMIGTTQAAEALKLLMGIGQPLNGRLLLLDALAMEWRTIKLSKDHACPVCADA